MGRFPWDDRHVWLVLTRWRDEESFQNWITSANFEGAHGGRDTEVRRQHSASDAGGPPPTATRVRSASARNCGAMGSSTSPDPTSSGPAPSRYPTVMRADLDTKVGKERI